MDKKAFKKKYSIAEVALLIIFALSLLLGHVLVIHRQKIELSEPYALDFAGVSVSIPNGEGWSDYGSWQFHDDDNDIMLTAQLSSNGHVMVIVQWRYIIAPERTTTFRLLAKRALVGGAQIMKTGQHSVDNALIEWAHAKVPGGIRDVFFGVALLSDGRALEIETMAPSDPELAKQIFEKVCKSLKYEPNDLIEKGSKFVAAVKDAGITSFIEKETNSTSELVSIFDKPEEKASGYWLDVYDVETTEEFGKVIKRDSRGYIAHGDSWIKINVFFKCDERFDTFLQQSQVELSDGILTPLSAIEKTSDGTLKCSSESFAEDKYYWPMDNAIPETLFALTLSEFIDSEYDDMVVDLVKGECLIVPAFVLKMSEQQVKELDENASYGIRVEMLDAEDKFDQILFDENKRIVKYIRRNQHVHTWKKSTREALIEKFKIQ